MHQNLSPLLLVLLASGASIHAQKQVTKAAPSVSEASATYEPPQPMNFAVAGLTKENLARVKSSLSELFVQVYACEACNVEEYRAGTCAKCTGALKTVQRPLLASVMPSPEQSNITVTLHPKRMVRLSALQAALKKDAITFDPAKFQIAGRSTLVIRGATADKVPAIQKALLDAKLFEEVVGSFDAPTSEVHVRVRSGATAPTHAKVIATLEPHQVQLGDVLFGHVHG